MMSAKMIMMLATMMMTIFEQSAFILYPERVGLPPWQQDSTMMLLPMLVSIIIIIVVSIIIIMVVKTLMMLSQFSWHLLGNLLLHGSWLILTKGLAESKGAKAAYSRF